MQITPRHKQEKQQEQTFFERLFKRNPQKKDAVVNLLPAEECRYISLALNMQKGFGPSLNVDYITSSGDEIKKFYYIDNDGSLREKNKLENNKESNQ